jgi:hypothetical protein
MKKLLIAVVAVLASGSALADGVLNQTPLKQKEWFDTLPDFPPLNTPILFGRMTTNEIANGTGNIMALIYEQGVSASPTYPWPLYVQLDSHHDRGDATGINTRYFSRGAGWGAVMHSEGRAFSTGTVIGSNIEMAPMTGSEARIIGINVQAKNGNGQDNPNIWSSHAINIQSGAGVGWNEGIRFDKNVHTVNAIYFDPNSWGQRAFYVDSAHYSVGVDTGATPVALGMHAGSKVCLESTQQICVRFNQERHRIEFLNGDTSLGYLDTTVSSDRCLNCSRH